MKAATTKATVVKKPKVFWIRVRELYMMGEYVSCLCSYCPWKCCERRTLVMSRRGVEDNL
jgi:hypothetical protein